MPATAEGYSPDRPGDTLEDRCLGQSQVERRGRRRPGRAGRGAKPGRRFLTALGADGAPDDPERVERSVPLDVGLERGLLAFGVNGAPLSPAHGGPVRLIMPGYFAVNSVKWV